jgi:hypothetical protein
VGFNNRTQIYDPQSGDYIYTILYEGLTHCRLSVDGDKILVASRNSGFIRDLTSKTQAQSIDYNGDGATFSPDGTYVASIYGRFLKIWKTETGHEVHGASTALYDEAVDIYFAPDEQLVAFKSKNGARCQILDVTTGRSLLTLVENITSVAFSLAFVACLRVYFIHHVGVVEIWDIHNCRPNNTIKVDNDVLDIALSPDDSRLVSLSPRHVKLWDLETKKCLAHLEFDSALGGKERVSFASDGASVSVEHNGRSRWWRIQSPASHINRTTSIWDHDGTKSWLICSIHSDCRNTHRMVFVPIAEKQSNQNAPQH